MSIARSAVVSALSRRSTPRPKWEKTNRHVAGRLPNRSGTAFTAGPPLVPVTADVFGDPARAVGGRRPSPTDRGTDGRLRGRVHDHNQCGGSFVVES
ncbi:hypothetical protein NJ7G_1852 [Natrinema sp. J7-2]|nr:hypothetical protein NJ7G_1852 [Natrinema sp. J7-2]